MFGGFNKTACQGKTLGKKKKRNSIYRGFILKVVQINICTIILWHCLESTLKKKKL